MQLKKLVVFNGDVSRMAWYRNGEPAPGPHESCELDFQWLDLDGWKRDNSVLDTPGNVVATRFSEGGRCLIGKDERGATVYHVWLMPAGTFVAWIGSTIRPPADGMLVSDAWVDPGYRGRNVHRWGAALIVRELVRLGGKIITAGVEEHEFYTFAAMYARLGLGTGVPHYCLYWLRAPGGLDFHWRWRPPKALRSFSEKLERAHGPGSEEGRR